MTCVDPVMFCDDPRDLNEFLGVRQSSGDIDQPGRHAEDTILHRLVSQGSHLIELLVSWLPRAFAHDFTAQTSLRQEMCNVSSRALLIDCVKILRGINRAAAAVASDDGRAPLQQVIDVRTSIPVQDRIVTVVMQIDKARADHKA